MTVIDRFRLDGKIAVVTGASKNIGLEITRAFAEAGATVIAVARTACLLEQRVADIVDQTGAHVIARTADVMDARSVADLIDGVHADFDQIDVLVNNAYAAGNTFGVPIFEIPDKDWEETFAANVLGPYRLCRGFGSSMIAGQRRQHHQRAVRLRVATHTQHHAVRFHQGGVVDDDQVPGR